MNPLRQLKFWEGSDPDRAQVARARSGDRTAFDTLVRTYERPLRGFVARRVRGDAAVDDVLQETWVGAWSGLQTSDKRIQFKAWLYGVALHKCTDYHRGRGRSAPEISLSTGDDQTLLDHLADQDVYAGVDLRDSVRTALRALPAPQRDVLDLYYYAQFTLAEIAVALGRKESVVKYHFYRAHAQLAEPLRELFADLPLPAQEPAPPRPR